MNADICRLVYGKTKYMRPHKIKAYAIYKQISENLKNIDNFVIAANDTNEISVSFNGKSDCKVFPFDKVFNSDVSQVELYDSLIKSMIQDVIMGLNCYLIICNLASSSALSPFEDSIPFSEVASVQTLGQSMLRELLLYTKYEENLDSSLHTSYFEVHGDKFIDFLSSTCEFKDFKIFKTPEQNSIEIEDLDEKFIVDESDISELFTKKSHSLPCHASICHSFFTVSLVRKNVSCDGFESIKAGKLTVVDFAKCSSNILETNFFEDHLQKISQSSESPARDKLLDILGPAFGGKAKTSIIVTLSSMLYSPEKDLGILQFVAQSQKIFNHPEANMKLIIPNSLKEYSEEIQELQKDFNAIKKGTGIEIKILKYRSLKNSITIENEKMKALDSYLLSLTDSINSKKQSLIGIHATTELLEQEIKEVGKCTENLKLDIEKIEEENNVKQKLSVKAEEIVAMKELMNVYEFNLKKLKLELTKANRNYDGVINSLESMKSDMVSLSYDIDAEKTSVKGTLDLLMTDMNNALSEFLALNEDLLQKLNNLSDIDVLTKSWKENTESLLSKCSSFVEEHNKNFDFIKLKMCSSLVPLHVSQTEIIEIIRRNRNEKWPVLLYHFHKVQVFCDSSFKKLSEIIYLLELIQNGYKIEIKTINSIICSSSKTLKKFVSDISDTIKISQQYFEDQEKNVIKMTELVHFHHKFKKQFDNSFTDLKNSLLGLREMCLSHDDAAKSKWNEIQKDSLNISQKHADLSENLFAIHKQMSSCTENLSQQKLNAFGYPQLKNKMENGESKTQQLLHIYKEMKAVTEVACELNKKGTDKELLEVKSYVNSQKTDVEKYFDNYFLTVKTTSSSFLDDLKDIQYTFSINKEELINNLEFLSSVISTLTTVYNNYQSVSSNILEKSSGALTFPPVINIETEDNMPEIESIFLDEWKVSSSTPNIMERKMMNKAYEKEKMLSQIKCIVEQNMCQKLNFGDLESEGKERKNQNLSTMSLPNLPSSTNLSTQPKACHIVGKNISKLKFAEKQS